VTKDHEDANESTQFYKYGNAGWVRQPTAEERATPEAEDPSVTSHNAVYQCGYSDGWNTRTAVLKIQPAKPTCAWCGIIILTDTKEHISQCGKAPYRTDLAHLRDYESMLEGHRSGNESPRATFNRLVTEAALWRESCAPKKAKKSTPRVTP
jgi:hypothetical protein